MNYRGLLSYNGFFVSKVPSWLWILVMGDKVLYLGNKQTNKKRCKPNSWCLFFPLFCLWLQIHWTALWYKGRKKFYCIDCYCFWWKLSCKITFGLSQCWIKVTSCLWLCQLSFCYFETRRLSDIFIISPWQIEEDGSLWLSSRFLIESVVSETADGLSTKNRGEWAKTNSTGQEQACIPSPHWAPLLLMNLIH